jgi:hypothetical protein
MPPRNRRRNIPLDDDGEEFDLQVSNDDTTESEPENGPRLQAIETRVAPLPSDGGGSRTAHDINHFFRRGIKSDPKSFTVCTTCE